MGSDFLKTLREVTIFMLTGRMILHLLPEGYEKYARIILGVMVLAMLSTLFLSAADPDKRESLETVLQQYQQEMERIGEQVASSGLQESDYAGQGLNETVKDALDETAARQGVYVTDVEADEEGRLTVTVSAVGKAETQEIRIDPVEVTVQTDKAKKKQGRENEMSAVSGEKTAEGNSGAGEMPLEELRSAFAKALGMEEERLEVIRRE